MKGLKTRAGQVQDAAAIRNLHQASIRRLCSGHYTPEQIERWTNRPVEAYEKAIQDYTVLVAEFQGELVGFGQMDLQAGLIHAIYVHPDYARRRIGSLLLMFLECAALQAKLERLTLASTLNAVEFYRAQDYTEIGPDTNVLPDGTGLPCVRMEKVLFRKIEFASGQTVAERVRLLLQSDDHAARRIALGELREQAPQETLEALVTLLEDSDEKVRRRVGSSLSALKMAGVSIAPRAEALAAYLEHGADPRVRLSCAIVLMSVPGPAVDRALLRALGDSSEKIAQLACVEVGDRGGAEGTEALFRGLNHPSWRVRLEACKALITQRTADARVVAALEAMQRGPDGAAYDAEVEESKECVEEFSKVFDPNGTAGEWWGKLDSILARARRVAAREEGT